VTGSGFKILLKKSKRPHERKGELQPESGSKERRKKNSGMVGRRNCNNRITRVSGVGAGAGKKT